MLLARLQRQPECRIARAIARLAHEPAGHDPLEGLATCEEARVRAAKAQRNAEALRRTNSDVGTLLTGAAPEHRSKRVGGENRGDARSARRREGRRQVTHAPRRRRVLRQQTEGARLGAPTIEVHQNDLDLQRQRPRPNHLDGLRMHILRNKEAPTLPARLREGHVHRLCRRRALVEERCVGDRESRQIGDERLVVEDGLQTPLRNLRLVGRVLRIPTWVLEDVPLDDGRHNAVSVAQANQRPHHPVLVRMRTQDRCRLALARSGREVEVSAEPDRLRHRLRHQRLQRRCADQLQHRRNVPLAGANVAREKQI